MKLGPWNSMPQICIICLPCLNSQSSSFKCGLYINIHFRTGAPSNIDIGNVVLMDESNAVLKGEQLLRYLIILVLTYWCLDMVYVVNIAQVWPPCRWAWGKLFTYKGYETKSLFIPHKEPNVVKQKRNMQWWCQHFIDV